MTDLAYIGYQCSQNHILQQVLHRAGVKVIREDEPIMILRRLNYAKIFYPITVRTRFGLHANGLLIDNIKKTVIYIEPHVGSNTQWYLDNIEKPKEYFPGYTFFDLSKCPKGFQTRETKYHSSCALWFIFLGWFLNTHSIEELNQLTDHDAHLDNFCQYISEIVPTMHVDNMRQTSAFNINYRNTIQFASAYFHLLTSEVTIFEMNYLNFAGEWRKDEQNVIDECMLRGYYDKIRIVKLQHDKKILREMFEDLQTSMKLLIDTQYLISFQSSKMHITYKNGMTYHTHVICMDKLNKVDYMFMDMLYPKLQQSKLGNHDRVKLTSIFTPSRDYILPEITPMTKIQYKFTPSKDRKFIRTKTAGQWVELCCDDIGNVTINIKIVKTTMDLLQGASLKTYTFSHDTVNIDTEVGQLVDSLVA